MPIENGEKIEHVIYDCAEKVQLHGDVYLQLVNVTPENWQALKDTVCPGQNLHKPLSEEPCIGIFCVRSNGDFVTNGCIVVCDLGVFYVIKGLNRTELPFMAMDEAGRIKIVR
jgi:hypothetical protein